MAARAVSGSEHASTTSTPGSSASRLWIASSTKKLSSTNTTVITSLAVMPFGGSLRAVLGFGSNETPRYNASRPRGRGGAHPQRMPGCALAGGPMGWEPRLHGSPTHIDGDGCGGDHPGLPRDQRAVAESSVPQHRQLDQHI